MRVDGDDNVSDSSIGFLRQVPLLGLKENRGFVQKSQVGHVGSRGIILQRQLPIFVVIELDPSFFGLELLLLLASQFLVAAASWQ